MFGSISCPILNNAWLRPAGCKSVTWATNRPFVVFLQDTPADDEGGAGEEDRPDSVASKTNQKKEAKVTNQFDYSERACQNLNNPHRVGKSSLAIHLQNG